MKKKAVRRRMKKRKTTRVMTIALSFKKIKMSARMILKKTMMTMKMKLFRISN